MFFVLMFTTINIDERITCDYDGGGKYSPASPALSRVKQVHILTFSLYISMSPHYLTTKDGYFIKIIMYFINVL